MREKGEAKLYTINDVVIHKNKSNRMREKGEAKLYTINDVVIHKNKSNRMAY